MLLRGSDVRVPDVRVLFIAALLLVPMLAQAQMYRWIDDSGKVHYSDQAPPSSARNVQKKPVPGGTGGSPTLPYALQRAVADFPVTLYTAEACNPCVQARALLNKRGVPYREVGIADAEGMEKLKSVANDTGVPVMTVGREVIKGFESTAYQAALDNVGYPSTSRLPPGAQARQIEKPVQKPVPAATEGEAKPAAETEQAPPDADAPK